MLARRGCPGDVEGRGAKSALLPHPNESSTSRSDCRLEYDRRDSTAYVAAAGRDALWRRRARNWSVVHA